MVSGKQFEGEHYSGLVEYGQSGLPGQVWSSVNDRLGRDRSARCLPEAWDHRAQVRPMEKRIWGLRVDQGKRLRRLERENLRLKRIVAEQALDLPILKEVTSCLEGDGRAKAQGLGIPRTPEPAVEIPVRRRVVVGGRWYVDIPARRSQVLWSKVPRAAPQHFVFTTFRSLRVS